MTRHKKRTATAVLSRKTGRYSHSPSRKTPMLETVIYINQLPPSRSRFNKNIKIKRHNAKHFSKKNFIFYQAVVKQLYLQFIVLLIKLL